MEKWKPIVGYEGYYEVSDHGRVRRVPRLVNTGIRFNEKRLCKGKMLKQNLKRNGYLTVDLSKDNKIKTMSVHRLVANAFLDKVDGKEYVNHINCNKKDNRAENLEWCTAQENTLHAKANGILGKPPRKPIRCKQTNMVFSSSYEAAEWVNLTKFGNTRQIQALANKIRCCASGHQKSSAGFTWEYVNRI